MQHEFYTIDNQSKYHFEITKLQNIEDAQGEFFSKEEILEMTGDSWVRTGVTIKRHAIVEALEELKAHLVLNNKKSMIIEDDDLVEALIDGTVSHFVEGLRRVGKRLSLHTPREKSTVPTKRDVQALISHGFHKVSMLFGTQPNTEGVAGYHERVHFECKYAHNNYIGAVNVLKKLVTIEQIIENVDAEVVNVAGFKMIWESPEEYCVKK